MSITQTTYPSESRTSRGAKVFISCCGLAPRFQCSCQFQFQTYQTNLTLMVVNGTTSKVVSKIKDQLQFHEMDARCFFHRCFATVLTPIQAVISGISNTPPTLLVKILHISFLLGPRLQGNNPFLLGYRQPMKGPD